MGENQRKTDPTPHMQTHYIRTTCNTVQEHQNLLLSAKPSKYAKIPGPHQSP